MEIIPAYFVRFMFWILWVLPNLTAFTAVIKRFVLGKKPGSDIQVIDDKIKRSEKAGTCGKDLAVFVAETESLLDLFQSIP